MDTKTTNTDRKLYDPALVKAALCKYFKTPPESSRLSTKEKRFLGLGGGQIHYYLFTLDDGRTQRQAFGKLGGGNVREHEALQQLMKNVPEKSRHFCRPITLIKDGGKLLLLLEYLDGYSSAMTTANSLRLFPNRAERIKQLGKEILDRLYELQEGFSHSYSPLTSGDTKETPGQPAPISVFKQLDEIKSLPAGIKAALSDRIKAVVGSETPVRRGLVHGQLGMRNIMINGSQIAFIDWEYMEPKGLSLYDSCYVATMILMRCVQLFLPVLKLNLVSDALFQHIERLEEGLAGTDHEESVKDSLWFAKCLALVDTLWQYETTESSGSKNLLGRERKKMEYLAFCLTNEAGKTVGKTNAFKRWNDRSDHYIQVSERRSSSAMVTAKKFIELAGIAKGSRVLDMGCGHGRIVEILVEKVPALDIVGVDMTRHLLDNFMVSSGTNGSRIELICGDITKLPLPDNSFDAAISSRVFQYLPDPVLGVREAYRVLKPGGAFVVAIPNKLNPIKYATYDASLYTPFQVRDWLTSAGFKDIQHGSMGFIPSSGKVKELAAFLESAGKVPLVKHFGGNVLVTGRKPAAK